jgi:cyanophycin synthetase
VTDEVHQDVRLMCERIARIIGLDCVGIDIVATALDQPLDAGSAGIVEVNAAPGFRMHLDPTEGKARNVAGPFVDMLFPPEVDFAVPIVAVTGTNGKTTTAKLIAHTLKYSGKRVGFAGTTGVEIDGVGIASGDFSGPDGAGLVLREPMIDHAILEVARGGILRRGLGFDSCDVGILLNIDEDHIGVDGVDDLEELALVKSTVIEVVKEGGVSVLNADDEIVAGLQERAGGQVVFFSLHAECDTIVRHLAAGGTAVVLQEGGIVIRSPGPSVRLLSVVEVPITLGGVAVFNIANVMAAVAALHGMGIPVDMIRSGIRTFHPSATQNPGRMNLIDFVTFKVLVDYAHNAPAVKALGRTLPHITKGRKIVVAHGTGSRLDEHIREFGSVLAEVYDHIIVADPDPRRRRPGETSELVRAGALEKGLAPEDIELVNDPSEAIDRAFAVVRSGDLIVVQVDEVEPMLSCVMAHFERVVGDQD